MTAFCAEKLQANEMMMHEMMLKCVSPIKPMGRGIVI